MDPAKTSTARTIDHKGISFRPSAAPASRVSCESVVCRFQNLLFEPTHFHGLYVRGEARQRLAGPAKPVRTRAAAPGSGCSHRWQPVPPHRPAQIGRASCMERVLVVLG